LDPVAVENRRLSARVVHGHGLHSIGPNEEWSLDGHDKLCRSMGIAIWGIVDKYSRLIIGHYAVPNNRLADTALACFLLLVEKSGGGSSLTKANTITKNPTIGIPIKVVADKGSETGKIHAVQTSLRYVEHQVIRDSCTD